MFCSAAGFSYRGSGHRLSAGPLICLFGRRSMHLFMHPSYLTHQIGQSSEQSSARELSNGVKEGQRKPSRSLRIADESRSTPRATAHGR